jgi:transcriptional regulator of acetoin/glycerol metabolism
LNTTQARDDSLDDGGPGHECLSLLWLHPELRVHALDMGSGPWRLGRDPSLEIPLDDAGVSRHHATLLRQGPLVCLRDSSSRNGTFVNATRIDQVPIRAGDVLRIGDQVGVFAVTARDLVVTEAFIDLGSGYLAGPTLQRALAPALRAAATTIPIVLEGATGTGKERIAEHLHRASGRKGPFHALNCAAIPEEIAESELFGHVRGAFSGAHTTQPGHVRAAHGGTLFLDELPELPQRVQAKLLRVLQEHKVVPLGDTRPIDVDLRVISACQGALAEHVQKSQLRADLCARLSGSTVRLPTLRERIEDVPRLFSHFVSTYAAGSAPMLDRKLIERLCLYHWPANVRELEFLARELCAVHGRDGRLQRAHLPPHIRDAGCVPATSEHEPGQRDLKRLAQALHQERGNITRACANLGISRARAYRLLDGQSIERLLARYPRRALAAPSSREE